MIHLARRSNLSRGAQSRVQPRPQEVSGVDYTTNPSKSDAHNGFGMVGLTRCSDWYVAPSTRMAAWPLLLFVHGLIRTPDVRSLIPIHNPRFRCSSSLCATLRGFWQRAACPTSHLASVGVSVEELPPPAFNGRKSMVMNCWSAITRWDVVIAVRQRVAWRTRIHVGLR